MMVKTSREEVLERWDKLPENIREALFSEENADLIEQIGLTYSLTEKTLNSLILAISNALHGFIRPGDFAAEISEIPGIQSELAPQITSVIDTKIFAPLKLELESIYKPPMSVSPTTSAQINYLPAAQEQKTQEPVVPGAVISSITPQQPTVSATQISKEIGAQNNPIKPSLDIETPFILHKEEEPKLHTETVPVNNSPLRPMFYKAPTASQPAEEKVLESRPIAARLELGVETQPVAESAPKMSRTPVQEVRQVNYSEFRTPLDNPFAGTFVKPADSNKTSVPDTTIKPASKTEPSKKAIVPDANVVNLKDLPL